MSGRSFTVVKIGDELNNAIDIRRMLREQDDPQLILDMIEGSTELHEAILVVHDEIQEDAILAGGLKAAIETLQSRQARIEKSIETRRQIILSAMVKAEIDTIKSPVVTLSTKNTPPKTIITEEAQIPAKFWKAQDPTLDKRALAEALKAGEIVPGAELSNGGITLGVRVK